MRPPRPLRLLVLAGLIAASSAAARAESPPIAVVQNDGWTGGSVTFPSGFQAGDTIAARLNAPAGFGAVIGLEIVFGGAAMPGLHTVTIKIWDDTAETLEPGPELFSTVTSLTSSNAIQPIPLAGIAVPSRFRVGIVLLESAPPVVGQDADGTIDADRNLVLRIGAGATWQRSQAVGATGDWIIRAQLAATSGGGGGSGGGSGGGGSGSGGDPVTCSGGCPAGQFCDPATQLCTFECVTNEDCGGAFCNRYGQCVGEGGCCQSGGGLGTAAAAVCAGLGVLALLLRRRQR
jgi:hypothetical protein